MDVLTTEGRRWLRTGYFVVLGVWNALFVAYLGVAIWYEGRPHVQPGATHVVLIIILYAWLVGNTVLLLAGLLLRRTWRPRPPDSN